MRASGRMGLLHVYQHSWWTGWNYIGTYTFDPKDPADVTAKIRAAQASASLGTINAGAKGTAEVLALSTAVAGVFIPGPDDIVLGAVIEKAVTILGKAGVKAIYKGGTWIFQKVGGKVLAGAAEAEERTALRETILSQLGGKESTWGTGKLYPRHLPPAGVAWSDIVKSTKHGVARYMPGQDIEILERSVRQFGQQCTKAGKTRWKVMQFDHVIGACEGKPVQWVVVEETGGPGGLVIHGHPITESRYKDLIKPR